MGAGNKLSKLILNGFVFFVICQKLIYNKILNSFNKMQTVNIIMDYNSAHIFTQ